MRELFRSSCWCCPDKGFSSCHIILLFPPNPVGNVCTMPCAENTTGQTWLAMSTELLTNLKTVLRMAFCSGEALPRSLLCNETVRFFCHRYLGTLVMMTKGNQHSIILLDWCSKPIWVVLTARITTYPVARIFFCALGILCGLKSYLCTGSNTEICQDIFSDDVFSPNKKAPENYCVPSANLQTREALQLDSTNLPNWICAHP